jgi:hypothetical protein
MHKKNKNLSKKWLEVKLEGCLMLTVPMTYEGEGIVREIFGYNFKRLNMGDDKCWILE